MIEARGIAKTYSARRGGSRAVVHALRGVDFTIPDAGAVSIIGESGCGKTTLGRILAGIETATSGDIAIDGTSLAAMNRKDARTALQRIQLIHQDPYSALNPTRTVETILGDALRLRAAQTKRDAAWVQSRMRELLGLVGLEADYVLPRYPHQLSGGMRQRVVIARALTVDPDVLVADEAVSMIDVSMRLGVLALLRRLRSELGVSVLFVTHDVATARYIGEDSQIYVLYRGTVIEHGLADEVIAHPVHPYTQSLLSAIPVLKGLEEQADQHVEPLAPLDEAQSDQGCLFAARCPFARDECTTTPPVLMSVRVPGAETDAPASSGTEHRQACLFPEVRRVIAVPVAG